VRIVPTEDAADSCDSAKLLVTSSMAPPPTIAPSAASTPLWRSVDGRPIPRTCRRWRFPSATAREIAPFHRPSSSWTIAPSPRCLRFVTLPPSKQPPHQHTPATGRFPTLRAMILLGVNSGLGNHDCALLPLSALDLDGGWLNPFGPLFGCFPAGGNRSSQIPPQRRHA
jgi:hypothetical protein